jgi:hypothetical protein
MVTFSLETSISGAPTQVSIGIPTRISVSPYPPHGFRQKSTKNHFLTTFTENSLSSTFSSILINFDPKCHFFNDFDDFLMNFDDFLSILVLFFAPPNRPPNTRPFYLIANFDDFYRPETPKIPKPRPF